MWAIKFLNGPEAGKVVRLKKGVYTIGRTNPADIVIEDKKISKSHGQLTLAGDQLIITDNNSSNGIFVNGVRVHNHALSTGDKITIGQILLDTLQLPENIALISDIQKHAPMPVPLENNSALDTKSSQNPLSYSGNTAITGTQTQMKAISKNHLSQMDFGQRVDKYIDEVALPVVYKFSDNYDLKYVIGGFVAIFVIIVTTLTILPVVQISRDFIVDESRRRAESLARLVVQENRDFLISNNEVNVSVSSIRKEPGVDKVFIIDAADGHIIAPINQRGKYSNLPFLQKARKIPRKYSIVNDKQIGVSLPVLKKNPNTGEAIPVAFSIILYNMDRVALDIERAIGLIIQILLITLIIGGALYFLLYRVILRPLVIINRKLDRALKNSSPNIDYDSPTPVLQKLMANINSALSRMSEEKNDGPQVSMGDKTSEAIELVNMFPVAAMAYSPDSELIIAINDLFLGHPLFDQSDLMNKYLEDISDSAMVENLRDLIDRSQENPNTRHTNTLPSQDGDNFEVTIKAIQESSTISYFVISFTEVYEEEAV